MKRFKRRKDGRFKAKSTEDRKVRSIRATDSAWESLGDLAEAQNMSRADLVEQLIEDGKLDFIQGLEIVQAIAKTLSTQADGRLLQDLAATFNPDQELQPLQELSVRLKPVKDLVAYLNYVQVLVEKLEPVQQLAQHIEPVKDLVEKLEPIQALAQQLEPLSQLEHLQDLGEQVDIIQTAARQIKLVVHESDTNPEVENPEVEAVINADFSHRLSDCSENLAGNLAEFENPDEQEKVAIALQVIEQYLEARTLDTCLPMTHASANRSATSKESQRVSHAELAENYRLSEFWRWLLQKLRS